MSLSELFTYSDIIIENQGKAIETYLTYEIGLNFSKQIKNHSENIISTGRVSCWCRSRC
jgi:hypothetical protein